MTEADIESILQRGLEATSPRATNSSDMRTRSGPTATRTLSGFTAWQCVHRGLVHSLPFAALLTERHKATLRPTSRIGATVGPVIPASA